MCVRSLLCLAAVAVHAVVASSDPYDITHLIPGPRGCWNPDTESKQFTLVVMPDTQYLFDQDSLHPAPLEQSFEYVTACNNLTRNDNIVFLAHLGDVAQNGLTKEYESAGKVFDRLDEAGVAYSVLAGNHDIDSSTDDSRGQTPYLSTFNETRFKKSSTWRGSSADGYNNYHVFRAGGREWLLLSLDWRMTNKSMIWVNKVIERHSSLPVILTTHDLVYPNESHDHHFDGSAKFDSYGEEIWNKIVRDNDQIFLTLNGHYWPPARTSRINSAGNKVDVQIANYQNRYYGGAAMIRKYHFDLEKNKIDVSTFSPWVHQLQKAGKANKLASQEANLTSDTDQFTMSVNFAERFSGFSKKQKRSGSKVAIVPGTQAYWRFDGHQADTEVLRGTRIEDRSGNGNTLIYHSPNQTTRFMHWSSSHHEKQPSCASISLQAQKKPIHGAYFQTVDNAPLNWNEFKHGYTFEAFLMLPQNFDPEQNAWSSVLSRWGTARQARRNSSDTDLDEPVATMSISNDREVQWRVYPTDIRNGTTNWSHELPLSEWWHVAVVNDGRRTKMYVDGCEVARNPAVDNTGLATVNKPWMVGGFSYNGTLDQLFHGNIGDIRIVDHALSVDQFIIA